MELIQKKIYMNQTGRPVTDQFYIDDDYNVPDSKGDIARIVLSRGTVQVEELKPVENYIRVIGKLYFQVLYVTDEGEPRLAVTEGKRPFEEMVYAENPGNDQYAVRDTRVDFAVTMIHSRKLSIKAMVELTIGADRIADVPITTDVEGEEHLYKKKREMQALQMHTCKRDTYRIKEEITIPGTKENIGTLLWTDISCRKLETRLGEDELNVSGELMVFCLYESQEGKTDWVEQTIPYSGKVTCSGVEEEMYHHVCASLEDVNVDVKIDEDGEMRLIGIEGTLELRIAVYEEENTEVLEDVYSLEKECDAETQEMICEELVLQNHSKCRIAEQFMIPELREDILQICHNSGSVQIEKTEAEEDGIRVEGVLHLQLLYVKENDEVPFDTWQGMIPFSYLIECGKVTGEMKFDIQQALEQLSVSLLGNGEVEVKAVLAFRSLIRRPLRKQVITGITLQPMARETLGKRPGIIGYVVREDDELWDLAKRYGTTVEGICEVNGLADERIKEGDRILIFKENMSIL